MGLFAHTQQARPGRWDLGWIQRLVDTCRDRDVELAGRSRSGTRLPGVHTAAIAKEMLHELRLVYFTPAEPGGGFLETDHFGVRFPHRVSHFDLTGVPQRWLRDLLWDYLADLLRSPRCPRTGGAGRRAPPGRHRAGRLPGARGARRRPRPRALTGRARPAVRRRPAAPGTRRACRRW